MSCDNVALMVIPLGLHYRSTSSASTVKLVHCVHCGKEFVYLLQRTATGHGFSPLFVDNERAASSAVANANYTLGAKLHYEFDAVPCVHCKMFQPQMVKKLRSGRYMWMWIVGLAVLVISSVTIVILRSSEPDPTAAPRSLQSMLIYPAIGFAMIATWFGLWLVFDPNGWSEVRKAKLCSAPAMDREAFDARMAKNAKAGYESFDPSSLFLKRMTPESLATKFPPRPVAPR